jgi:hypothetical protein
MKPSKAVGVAPAVAATSLGKSTGFAGSTSLIALVQIFVYNLRRLWDFKR